MNRLFKTIKQLFVKKRRFMDLYEEVTEEVRKGIHVNRIGDKLSPKTIANYETSASRFIKFQKIHGTIYLEDINKDFVDKFTLFLKENGYAKNSVAQTLARLKTVLRKLHAKGIGEWDGSGIKTNAELVTTVFCTIEELRLMLELDLTRSASLQRVRDIFVMQCFVGLRYGDFKQFLSEPRSYVREQGGKLFAEIKTHKTGAVVVIPLANIVKQLLDRYDYDFGQPFSYQFYNLMIKEVAKEAALTQEVMFTRTEGGVRTDKLYPKYQLICSHTARRTFATNAFLSGMPEKNIMLITGHLTTESFSKYIRCSNLDAAIKIANHDFFNIDMPMPLELPTNDSTAECSSESHLELPPA